MLRSRVDRMGGDGEEPPNYVVDTTPRRRSMFGCSNWLKEGGALRWGGIESLPSYLAPSMELAASTAELLLDRLETGGSEAVSPRWLATKLDSKRLWVEPGGELMAVLLREGEPSGADAVLRICVEAAGRPPRSRRRARRSRQHLGSALMMPPLPRSRGRREHPR